MKRVLMWVLPVCMCLVLGSALRAEEKSGTWNVTVGCAKCNFSKDTSASSCSPAAKTEDGKVVFLKGDAMKGVKYKKGGQYVVKGTLAQDGKTINVAEIKAKEG